jgi:hypothetical protein
MPDLATNVLCCGDNVDILRRYLPDGAGDLVYLDPPFNSNRDYNVIFRDESGNATDAQLLAREDTWHWGPSAEATSWEGTATATLRMYMVRVGHLNFHSCTGRPLADRQPTIPSG